MKEIKYIAFYNDENVTKGEKRTLSVALNSKMNYILNTLNKIGYKVNVVSPNWTNADKGLYKGKVYTISSKLKLTNFFTFGSKIRIFQYLNKLFCIIQLIVYLLIKTKFREKIIVYHSLPLMYPINIVKKIKRLDILLEVEEIYSDVWKEKENSYEKTYINKFRNYIISNENINQYIGYKDAIVLYGNYCIEHNNLNIESRRNKIEVVYAGSIDTLKSGAMNAVEAMRHLTSDYRLSILGFGEKSDVDKLKSLINSVNNEMGREVCIFYGVLVGKDYTQFLRKCDIGLNPQKIGDYMNTAFPSKILSYLRNNLYVVSTRIKNIEESKLSEEIFFANDDSPKEISKVIKSINIEKKAKNIEVIQKLDIDFQNELRRILEK